MAWQPRKWTPRLLQVLRLYYQGHTYDEIASLTGYHYQSVAQLINSPASRDILAKFQDKTLDTILDIQADVQAIAPAALEEKVRLALSAKDERVRNTACSDILAMAGHKPIDRVSLNLEKPPEDPFAGKTEAEIRASLLEEVLPTSRSVH